MSPASSGPYNVFFPICPTLVCSLENQGQSIPSFRSTPHIERHSLDSSLGTETNSEWYPVNPWVGDTAGVYGDSGIPMTEVGLDQCAMVE